MGECNAAKHLLNLVNMVCIQAVQQLWCFGMWWAVIFC